MHGSACHAAPGTVTKFGVGEKCVVELSKNFTWENREESKSDTVPSVITDNGSRIYASRGARCRIEILLAFSGSMNYVVFRVFDKPGRCVSTGDNYIDGPRYFRRTRVEDRLGFAKIRATCIPFILMFFLVLKKKYGTYIGIKIK